MRRATQFSILGAAAMAYLMMGVPAVQAINFPFNNKPDHSGDHKWETLENWGDGTRTTLPGAGDVVILNQDATVNSEQTVNKISIYGRTLDVLAGANVTVGNAGIAAASYDNDKGSMANLNIDGGQLSTKYLSVSGKNGISITISAGTLTRLNGNGVTITPGAGNTHPSSFTLSDGAFVASSGNGNFELYGPDAAHHASFNIIGSAGSFSLNHNLILFNLSTSDPDSATDVTFTFGATPTLTTVNTAVLKLNNNALTIDFSNIQRPTSATDYSVTLFDTSFASISGDFATPTFNGLGSNETAMVAKSVDGMQYLLNFTLAPVPEPASLLLLGAGGLLMLPRRRRERVAG